MSPMRADESGESGDWDEFDNESADESAGSEVESAVVILKIPTTPVRCRTVT